MTQTLTRYKSYEADYEARKASQQGHPSWLQDIQEKAWAHFQEVGFPTARRGNEPWKYTNVGPIADADFRLPKASQANVALQDIQAIAPWQDDWTTLVFVNGQYSESLSNVNLGDSRIQVSTLAEAIKSGSGIVKKHLGKQTSEEEDGFIALNTAFIDDGAVVHIPEGTTSGSVLHILFVATDSSEPTVSHPRVLVVAGPSSKTTLLESFVGLGESRYFTNAITEIVLEEGAELEHHRLMLESEQAFHIGVARVHQDESSVYKSKVFEKRVGLGRFDLYDSIDGPGVSCDLKGLYFTTGSQHMDNFININHEKPESTSRLYYKGILDGKSRAVFGGTVYVQRGAIKTDSHQEDKNLVLSPDAEVDSKPSLFIYADDVKCGHGATAGNIDEDTVFYMRSRGIDLLTASRFLIYGFASEIIDTVENEYFHDYLEKLFLDSLPSYEFEF